MKNLTKAVLVIVSVAIILSFVYLQLEIENLTHKTSPVITPSPSEINGETGNYTFIVYKWQGGNVTRDMLGEYASVRGAIRTDLVFTYTINSDGGLVAYNGIAGVGFNIAFSQFEEDLTKNSHGWTKTNETITLPIGLYGSDQGTNYAYLFS